MKSSHSSSEPTIVGNQVSAKVTPDYEAAIEQPSQLVIDKNSLSIDAFNQMDLDRLADVENVDIGPCEMKDPLVASEPVLEDKSNDPDTVQDDAIIIMLYFRFQMSPIKAICFHDTL